MSLDKHLEQACSALRHGRDAVNAELHAYPKPISGCDVQYTHLIAMRSAYSDALRALETPRFVATPRILEPGLASESR